MQRTSPGLLPASYADEPEPATDQVPMHGAPAMQTVARDVYFPGTEELKPDEIRVICTGSGMPMPRLKQAAASFVVELGNGDKFIFDIGIGARVRTDA